ncbi:hypothetical protein KP509_20G033000 [Ceratopteris richardii]|uniref:Uncharacterized protein n=1 Tax=Ceratopteris richardii TaxID=49495 RepID=A0A8T2SGG9_CERRI|nr:hypothetical protein KP509_20G033000 [Ceratopteris richardii]
MESFLACFRRCQGVRPSQCRIASRVTKKQPAIAAITTGLSNCSIISTDSRCNRNTSQPNCERLQKEPNFCDGLGILIYPSLLLTTHSIIPSPASAQDAEISLCYSGTNFNILRRRFLPELFFATDATLNVTVIACEFVNPEIHPLGLDSTTVDAKAFEVGRTVYVLGHERNKGSIKLSVGRSYVLSQSNAAITIRSEGKTWLRGSAGFDRKGNFALIVTDSKPEEDATLRNECVSIHSIRNWLEPQWHERSETCSATVLQPLDFRPSIRDAGFFRSGTESTVVEACAKCDEKHTSSDGAVTSIVRTSSIILHADHKILNKQEAEGDCVEVEDGGQWLKTSRKDNKGHESKKIDHLMIKPRGTPRDERQRTSGTAKSTSWTKEVKVMRESENEADRYNSVSANSLRARTKAVDKSESIGGGYANRANVFNRANSSKKLAQKGIENKRTKGKPAYVLRQDLQREQLKPLQLRLNDIAIAK